MPFLALPFPAIDPVAFAIGPFAVRWYALAYIVGLVGGWFYARRLASREDLWAGLKRPTTNDLDDLIVWVALGVVLGGRIGYILFYNFETYLADPLEIFKIWQGGMSFHGGFLGVLVALTLVARKHRIHWFAMSDFLAPLAPLALAAGRLGNFINGELYGRPTDVPWGMIFQSPDAGPVPRHPSQLYQFALEGVLLFVILWIYSSRRRPEGAVSGAFLIGYGVLRFIAEFFREPDDFLGLLALRMSMGQWLSLPMIAIGAVMMVWAYRRAPRTA